MKAVDERTLIVAILILQVKCNIHSLVLKDDGKLMFYDAILPVSKRKFQTNLSSKISQRTFPNASLYNAFKPGEVIENYVEAEDQATGNFLSQTTLNALRKAMFVHPFQTWKLKDKYSSVKDMRIDEDKLHEVIDNGRNERLKLKLHKVLRGEDVYLDVFGGSNTGGGGLTKDVGGIEGIFPKVITDWWEKTITPITGSNIKLHQIAMGGTSSEFHQFCFGSYIHKQLDLVFVEMSVNDVRPLQFDAHKSLPLEQLTRQLLEYPTEAAVLYVNLFTGRSCNKSCSNLQDHGQDILTDTYNITSLSWRECFCNCPKTEKDKQCFPNACEVIASDGNHINQLGHAHIALMIINIFRRIILDHVSCVFKNSRVVAFRKNKSTQSFYEIKSSRKKMTRGTSCLQYFTSRDDPEVPRETSRQTTELPPPVFIKTPSNIISEPRCWTSLTPNFQTFKIENNLDIIVTKTEGFYMMKNTRIGKKCKPPCRVDRYSSWVGRTVGATTSLWFTVPARSDGMKTRSVAIAVRTSWPGGAANMWLDNDYRNKKFVNTKLGWGRTVAMTIAQRVEPGGHTLNVEIVKKGDVSIVGIMIGPPDGPY